MRILVADDDAAIRDLLAEILTDEGHRVVQASTVEDALGLSRVEDWDLFLIDTLGQADDGPTEEYEGLVRALAGRAPVILCTGRAHREALRRPRAHRARRGARQPSMSGPS